MTWAVFATVLAATSPFLLAMLGALGWLYRHERERREGAERMVAEEKHRAYSALLDVFFDSIKATKKGEFVDQSQVADRMIDSNKDLIVYGSDEVVRTYQRFTAQASGSARDLLPFAEVVLAIRRDMGHPKTTLTEENVLRQLLADYDELMRQLKA